MAVQMLNPQYVQTLKKKVISNDDWGGCSQLDRLVASGEIKESGGNYFVVGAHNIQKYQSWIQPTDTQYMINNKGIVVERQKRDVPANANKKTSMNYTLDALTSEMKLTDLGMINKLKTHLAKQEGITVADNGEVTFNDVTKLNAALKSFADENKDCFVVKQNTATFTEDSDPDVIAGLQAGDNPAIVEDTNNSDNVYKINNEDELNKALPTHINTEYKDATNKTAAVAVNSTTITTYDEDLIGDIPADLKDNKAVRKDLEKRAQAAYAELLAGADPELRDAADIYIAERKYNKQIEQKMKDLSQYEVQLPGQKSKKVTRDGADIVQYYIDNYANNKDELNNFISQLKVSTAKADQAAIIQALRDEGIVGVSDNFDEIPDNLKQKGALLCTAQKFGLEPEGLKRFMATYEVMNSRTSKQVLDDDKWFINEQSKEYVKNQQAAQNISNTTLHFSKEDKKNTPADGKIHNDIGKEGRYLVQACPQMFCDEVQSGGDFSVGGKSYKLNQQKYDAFMQLICDPASATDASIKLVFGGNTEALADFKRVQKEFREKDLNLTLQEGRQVLMSLKLPTSVGETGTLTLEQIIGNGNNKADNKEINALRHMVEATGRSIDGNSTYGKRLLKFLGDTAIGYGIGFLIGGAGSLMSGAVKIVGQTASQLVSYSGMTNGQTISGVATTQVTTTDYYTDKFGTTSVTHTTDVNIPYQQNVPGQAYSGQVEAPGQPYSGEGNHHLSTANNAGMLAGLAAAVNSLRTLNGVQERGRNTDDVFKLQRKVVQDESSEQTVKLEIPQYTKEVTIETETEVQAGSKACKLRVVRHPSKKNHNLGETMESMVAKYYNVEIGSSEYNEIFNKVKDFNQVQRFGGMQYTADNTFYLPDFIILANGSKVNRVANPEDPNEHIRLDDQDIPLGGHAAKHKASASQTGATSRTRCTKR